MSEIHEMGAVGLARRIRDRSISVRDCVAAFLARIAADNGTYNAIVAMRDEDDILREAATADDGLAADRGISDRRLFGLPIAIKDLSPVRGLRTTLGSPIFADTVTAEDGLLAERLRRAGAIIIGKTNAPEFGLGSHTHNPVFGATANAWDPSRTAGGSSGGAAVALARRMLPIADGSDVGGSLRNPAGWNNVLGFRPSQGVVPLWPADDAFSWQLGTNGPMARSVADLVLLLDVLAGHDARAPLSRDVSFDGDILSGDVAAAGRRIGWLGDLGGRLPFEPGILELTEAALKLFEETGARVEPVESAFDFAALWRAFVVLRAVHVGATLKPHHDDPDRRALLKPEAVYEVETALSLTALDVADASRVRTAWYHSVRDLFERFDALVLPTAQVFPFDIALDWPKQIGGRTMHTYHQWMEVAAPATLAGLPVVNLPAGFGGPGGARLPMGLQLIGAPRADAAVLGLAAAYEQVCPFLAESPL